MTEDAAPISRRDARRLRGDLDAICLTALRREPDQRYASAHDLASGSAPLSRARARRGAAGCLRSTACAALARRHQGRRDRRRRRARRHRRRDLLLHGASGLGARPRHRRGAQGDARRAVLYRHVRRRLALQRARRLAHRPWRSWNRACRPSTRRWPASRTCRSLLLSNGRRGARRARPLRRRRTAARALAGLRPAGVRRRGRRDGRAADGAGPRGAVSGTTRRVGLAAHARHRRLWRPGAAGLGRDEKPGDCASQPRLGAPLAGRPGRRGRRLRSVAVAVRRSRAERGQQPPGRAGRLRARARSARRPRALARHRTRGRRRDASAGARQRPADRPSPR